jgi:hypothetical protein
MRSAQLNGRRRAALLALSESGELDAIRSGRYQATSTSCVWECTTKGVEDSMPFNNAAERAIRPIAIGRKNWLFAGSDKGGERAAGILSLIESAKLSGIDPEAYLRIVLTKIADHPISTIDELLPWKLESSSAAA